MTLLIVTAVQAEADAIKAGLPTEVQSVKAGSPAEGQGDKPSRPARPAASEAAEPSRPAVEVVAVGAGPYAAAAGTARLLAESPTAYTAVISAGIAGAFPGRADIGATVLSTRSIAADLGAETPDGFLPIDQLGFGTTTIEADPDLLTALRKALPQAITGDILTLATVTGTAATAARLAAAHPHALAEAMEGHGVATAAAAAGLPFAELRTISNLIGPRDRASWRLPDALAALTKAAATL